MSPSIRGEAEAPDAVHHRYYGGLPTCLLSVVQTSGPASPIVDLALGLDALLAHLLRHRLALLDVLLTQADAPDAPTNASAPPPRMAPQAIPPSGLGQDHHSTRGRFIGQLKPLGRSHDFVHHLKSTQEDVLRGAVTRNPRLG